jgi:hypothetical protein
VHISLKKEEVNYIRFNRSENKNLMKNHVHVRATHAKHLASTLIQDTIF